MGLYLILVRDWDRQTVLQTVADSSWSLLLLFILYSTYVTVRLEKEYDELKKLVTLKIGLFDIDVSSSILRC